MAFLLVAFALAMLVLIAWGAHWDEKDRRKVHGMADDSAEEAIRRLAYVLGCDNDPNEVVRRVEGLLESAGAYNVEAYSTDEVNATVFRLVEDSEITMSRGAEILGWSLLEFRNRFLEWKEAQE